MRALLVLFLLLTATLGIAQRDTPPLDAGSATSITRSARDLARITQSVRATPDPRTAAAIIPADLFGTSALRETLVRMGRGDRKARETALVALDSLRVAAESPPDPEALARVKAIKAGAEYRKAKVGTASTWFGRTLEGISRWFSDMMRKLTGRPPNVNAPDLPKVSLPGWLIYVVWVLLAGIVIAAAWPLVRLIRFRVERRKRKAKGILEEEPERTKSEYLTLGDELAARGDFRGAIRMRYLAALKRFDEARVARFDRGETNWEHLARIRSSPTLPEGLDFRPATAAFDHYWYGKRIAGAPDYQQFVAWYDEVDAALRRAVAA